MWSLRGHGAFFIDTEKTTSFNAVPGRSYFIPTSFSISVENKVCILGRGTFTYVFLRNHTCCLFLETNSSKG